MNLMNAAPTTIEVAMKLLDEHVTDVYQKRHAKMVAHVLKAYANKLGEDPQLWYLTGILHDLDYDEFPTEHPLKCVAWLTELGYPLELINAIKGHYRQKTGYTPTTKLDFALIAVDELCGFLYAYSLMRPQRFVGMEPAAVSKKFKDKTFASKINRDEITYGIEKFGVSFDTHVSFVIEALSTLPDL